MTCSVEEKIIHFGDLLILDIDNIIQVNTEHIEFTIMTGTGVLTA